MLDRIIRAKTDVPITDLLDHYEVKYHKYSDRRIKIRCFFPDHKDSNPSGLVFLNDNFYHCFACVFHGDIIDIVMKVEELGRKEAVEWVEKTFNLEGKAKHFDTTERELDLGRRLAEKNLECNVYDKIHNLRKRLGPNYPRGFQVGWNIINDEREKVDTGELTLIEWQRRAMKRIRESLAPMLKSRRVVIDHLVEI